MNTPIRYLSVFCLVLFLALMANATYVQFVHADSLDNRNGNRRVIDEEFSRQRGAILVAGVPIAESVPSGDNYKFKRVYAKGPLYAPITGYFSYIFGRSGIEDSQNKVLSGSDNRLFVNRVVDLIGNKQPEGGSVELTIDPKAQAAAMNGLQALGPNTRGAVTAIDAQTGAVLALVTMPSFNPSTLASHKFGEVQKSWNRLTKAETQPMLDRATQQSLPPGSVFKLVTASAALSDLGLRPSSQIRAGSALAFPGIDYQLTNLDHSNCGGAKITFEHALNVSCNVAFGALAGKIGQERLTEQAAKFGFGTDFLGDLPMTISHVTADSDTLEAPQLAQSGIGQFNVTATPLQMAMVGAGIANDGRVMRPYLVDTVRDPELRVLEKAEPEEFAQALSPSDSAALREMMQSTVTRGTATSAGIPGVEVGGKTGTAQRDPSQPPYAWFVSYGKANGRTIAVAVVVESSSTLRSEIAGGRLAGPIARSVMQAVLTP